MRRRVVEIEIVFLDVLAVVSLFAADAEHAFFEKRIATVPHRQCETEILVTVANAGDSVLVPTVSTRAGVIVRKVIPRVAIGAVIFANRSPGALGQEWPPAVPMPDSLPGHLETDALLCVVDAHGGGRLSVATRIVRQNCGILPTARRANDLIDFFGPPCVRLVFVDRRVCIQHRVYDSPRLFDGVLAGEERRIAAH